MAYRDDVAAARERAAAIERELAQAGTEHLAHVQELGRQLAEAWQVIDAHKQPPSNGGAIWVIWALAGAGVLGGGIVHRAFQPAPMPVVQRPTQTAMQNPIARSVARRDYDSGGLASSVRRAKADDTMPETLSKGEIVSGMRAISECITACYKIFEAPGLANVLTTIRHDGSVSSAKVVGTFAETPTGICVEYVVKRAHFPAFRSSSQTITYPFMLR